MQFRISRNRNELAANHPGTHRIDPVGSEEASSCRPSNRIRSLLYTILLALVLSCPAASWAQAITVVVDFRNSGLSQADQDAIFQHVMDNYAGIPGVNNLRFTTEIPNPVDVNTTIIVNVSSGVGNRGGNFLWGRSRKSSNTASVFVGEYSRPSGGHNFTAEEMRRAIGDTTAHELGHLLCALHETDAGVDKPPTDKMRGAPTDDIKRMAGRSFGADSRNQISRGIDAFVRLGGFKWRLGDMPEDVEETVEWVTGMPTDPTITALESTNFDAHLHLSSLNVDFGWINIDDQFFEYIHRSQLPVPVEFDDGDVPNFAIRTASGLVFDMDSPNFVGPVFSGIMTPESQALVPRGTYFSEVQFAWDLSSFGLGTVVARLSADRDLNFNGFRQAVPEPGSLILLAIGLAALLGCGRHRSARRG